MARILISEADSDVRRLLGVMVDRLGHETIVLEPDVVVPPPTDMMLLDPESPTCLEEARLARAYQPELPIVCLGLVPKERGGFLERGLVAFLPKPFTLEALRRTVDRMLVGSPI